MKGQVIITSTTALLACRPIWNFFTSKAILTRPSVVHFFTREKPSTTTCTNHGVWIPL